MQSDVNKLAILSAWKLFKTIYMRHENDDDVFFFLFANWQHTKKK